jgi:hypothetical protein
VVALPARPPDSELIRVREEARDGMLELLNDEPDTKTAAKAQQPVRVASFKC